MHHKILPFAFVALQLLGNTMACPFHVELEDSASTPFNNKRRSLPGKCEKTAIEDVRVFNGVHFGPPRTICMDGGYILHMDSCNDAANIVNATGKFLLPGLIESHVHLTDVESLENITAYGVTTARHMNCRNAPQCDIMKHQPGLASLIRAGRSAVGKGSPHERQDPTRPKDTLIYADTNVTQFTEWQFNNGSDFHKITAEINGPSLEQQIEMVRVAHCQYKSQTNTHASDVAAYHQAVESMTDGIQHVPDDGILTNATIQKIKAQGQFVTPTLNVFEYAYRDPLLQQYFAVKPGSNRTLAHAETNAKLLYRAGVPLIPGTDSVGTMSVNGSQVSVPFGLTLHYEMQNFVNILGMGPAEAINAATRDAAKWQRLNDRGTVEGGKRADLVLLNSNPLVNINNTLDIESSWVFGIKVTHLAKDSQ